MSDAQPHEPRLDLVEDGALRYQVDGRLLRDQEVLVAFTTRAGGVSEGPYASLNLALHVGDSADAVDENRRLLLSSLRLPPDRLTCAEQVHGDLVVIVEEPEAGSGAHSASRPPVAGADALITALPETPLALFFADCVPVVLVATRPRRVVAVVHAGWRGALASLPGKSAKGVAECAGCETSDLLAYVGPHICPEHYEVGPEILSLFSGRFATICEAPVKGGRPGRLDLGAAVSESLSEVGVPADKVAKVGLCTFEHERSYYSYRRHALTGRHGAVASILREGR